MVVHHLNLPLDEARVRALAVGDAVRLSGILVTARDAVHRHLAAGGSCPVSLAGAVIYHCGPVTVRGPDGWTVTAAGPTTSIREEPYMGRILSEHGVRGIIGKGGMGDATLSACAEHGCVYFHAVGGAAQVLADCIVAVRDVHFLERFGAPEALWVLGVHQLPVIVTMDAHGNSLHRDVAERSAAALSAATGR